VPIKPLPHGSLPRLIQNHLIPDEDAATADLIQRLRPVRRRGYLTKRELEAVCRWKSPRAIPLVQANTPYRIRKCTASALGTRRERLRLDSLLGLRGVSVPMASAVLTLLDPKRYGVLDIRVWQLLHTVGVVLVNRGGTQFTPDQWLRFLTVLRVLAHSLDLPVRTIERTLFSIHEKYQDGNLYAAPRRIRSLPMPRSEA